MFKPLWTMHRTPKNLDLEGALTVTGEGWYVNTEGWILVSEPVSGVHTVTCWQEDPRPEMKRLLGLSETRSLGLDLSKEDVSTIAFVGGRYAWSDALTGFDVGFTAITMDEAKALVAEFYSDTEGGHSFFPMLDYNSFLASKLKDLIAKVEGPSCLDREIRIRVKNGSPIPDIARDVGLPITEVENRVLMFNIRWNELGEHVAVKMRGPRYFIAANGGWICWSDDEMIEAVNALNARVVR